MYPGYGAQIDTFSIDGTVKANSVATIYIRYHQSPSVAVEDSITVRDSKFFYKGLLSEPSRATFAINGETVSFYIESKKMLFIGDAKNFSDSRLYGSSIENDSRKIDSLMKIRIDSNRKINNEVAPAQVKYKLDTAFISEHPESYLSLILLNFHYSDVSYDYAYSRYVNCKKFYLRNSIILELESKLSNSRKSLPGSSISSFSFSDNKNRTYNLKQIISDSTKLILLDFWASWCLPCRENAPFLHELYSKFKDRGLAILSISVDADKDEWRQAINNYSMYYWYNGIDDTNKSIQKKLGVELLPTYFLLNNRYEILGRYSGRWKGQENIRQQLEKSLYETKENQANE